MCIMVFCTCPNHGAAEQIARTLVEKHLAACVNILPKVTSIYQWEGEVQQDSEVLLLIKTRKARFSEIASQITAKHPYELPEIIAVSIEEGLPDYLNWIRKSTGQYHET